MVTLLTAGMTYRQPLCRTTSRKWTFGSTKGGILRNVITHNVVRANLKTEFFVYRGLRAVANFTVTCLPAFA